VNGSSLFSKTEVTCKVLYWVACAILILCYFDAESYHLINGSDGYLTFHIDDFYYYLITAKNIVLHGSSTFDGITVTNGYHPLWMLMLLPLVAIAGGTGVTFFYLFLGLLLVLALYTAKLYWDIGSLLLPESRWRHITTFIASAFSIKLIFLGMETSIAIPIFLLVCRTMLKMDVARKQDWFVLSLLCSGLIFSRLDTIVFVAIALLLLLVGYSKEVKKYLLQLLLGFIPVIVYLISNLFLFGSLFTVSSQAKVLRTSFGINEKLLRLVQTNVTFDLAVFVLIVMVAWQTRRLIANKGKKEILLFSVLSYPMVYFVLYSLTSSWVTFPWYYFMIPMTLVAGSVLVLEKLGISQRFPSVALLFFVVVAWFFCGRAIAAIPEATTHFAMEPWSIYSQAKELKAFAKEHPGSYAMGDRAGLTSFVLDKPMLQLEGLVADRSFLKKIKEQRDLVTVLKEYRIRYYITSVVDTLRLVPEKGYELEEPHQEQAGTYSPKMRGVFKSEPVYRYEPSQEDRRLAGKNDQLFSTYVFDVTKEKP